ncbi:hypothetical protein BDF19DRAFT_228106 [Syncephalis fuscata]|nr:hypothetical protein BDF19DRAFT_228106 [Syncephalis fuscata]
MAPIACTDDVILEMNGIIGSSVDLSEAIVAATSVIDESSVATTLMPSISPADIFPNIPVTTSDRRPVMSVALPSLNTQDRHSNWSTEQLARDDIAQYYLNTHENSSDNEDELQQPQSPFYESASSDDESYHDDSDLDDPFVALLKEIAANTQSKQGIYSLLTATNSLLMFL